MPRYLRFNRKNKSAKVDWKLAPDIKKRLVYFIKLLDLNFLKPSRIFVFRSLNSTSRAYARTWAFPRIWQLALDEQPAYIIEVLEEKFNRLSKSDQDKVLLHELSHIPKNFSGSLLPHSRKGKNSFHKKLDRLISQYISLIKN